MPANRQATDNDVKELTEKFGATLSSAGSSREGITRFKLLNCNHPEDVKFLEELYNNTERYMVHKRKERWDTSNGATTGYHVWVEFTDLHPEYDDAE